MSDVKVFMPSLLEIAPNAIEKLRSLKVEECDDSLKLRIFVTGGGCSGLQYGFSFDGAAVEDDTLISRHGVDVLIPGGGIPMLLFSRLFNHNVEGAPVMNGIPILVKMTEMAVKLRRLTGLNVSRTSDFALPPQEIIDQFISNPKDL